MLLSKKPLQLARSKTSNETGVTPKPKIIERFSSEELKPQSFDVDAMLRSSKSYEATSKDNPPPPPTSSQDIGLRVDSRNDFMSAMREAAANYDIEELGGNDPISSHLMSSLGSMSTGTASTRRRFFTMPAMATIQESDTEENNRLGGLDSSIASQSPNPPKKRSAALDTELILHEDKAKPKQFRVPQLAKVSEAISTDGISSFLDSLPQPTETVQESTNAALNSSESSVNQNTLLANDDDIETAGTAFLDKISETMGLLK